MECPKCGGEWIPENMETHKDKGYGQYVWRRRVCEDCSHTESTWEYPYNAGRIIKKLRKQVKNILKLLGA